MATIEDYRNGYGTWFDVEPNTGCWLWLRNCNQKGYGLAWIDGDRYHVAHRLYYRLYVGPLIDGLVIMHKCDTPECVNPSHLEQGTQSQNVQDGFKRGRIAVSGSRNGQTKLTDEQARDVQDRYSDGQTQKAIAEYYSVSQSLISLIVHGRRRVNLSRERIISQ